MANENIIQGYVVGLMFRRGFSEVALIEKNRPQWQAGKLNGVGGKIENLESPYEAMVREFQEETGFFQVDWHLLSETFWNTGYIRYFTCSNNFAQLQSITDEKVGWFKTDEVLASSGHLIPNLHWIIPMAIQWYNEPFFASVDYSGDPAIKQINEHKTNNPST